MNMLWDQFHERFFHRNANSMENSVYSRPSCSKLIAIKYCTWHDSCVVVACAKFGSDMIPYERVIQKQILHRI